MTNDLDRSDNPARRRILLVDDEHDVIEVLVRLLKGKGFSVLAVQNPLRAAEQAAPFCPEIAILDFDMPGLTGPELAITLRKVPGMKDLPCIFLSGMTDQDHQLIGRASGAAAYLSKPVDPVTLVDTLRTILDNRRR